MAFDRRGGRSAGRAAIRVAAPVNHFVCDRCGHHWTDGQVVACDRCGGRVVNMWASDDEGANRANASAQAMRLTIEWEEAAKRGG